MSEKTGKDTPPPPPVEDDANDVDVKKSVKRIESGIATLLDKKDSSDTPKPQDPPAPPVDPTPAPPGEDEPPSESNDINSLLGSW